MYLPYFGHYDINTYLYNIYTYISCIIVNIIIVINFYSFKLVSDEFLKTELRYL